MKIHLEALVASLFATAVLVVAAAGVAAMTALDHPMPPSAHASASQAGLASVAGIGIAEMVDGPVREGTLGLSVRSGVPPASTEPAADPTPTPTPAPTPRDELAGTASNYPGTADWMGQATVALPGEVGGRYTGEVNGHVTVCADRCARLPVVDWCQCYWGSADQRVVDLSHPAWALVSDTPLAEGLTEVRLILER